MLHSRLTWTAFVALLTINSLALANGRPDGAGRVEDAAPAKNADKFVALDRILGDAVRASGIDKVLQGIDVRKPEGSSDKSGQGETVCEKRNDANLENVDRTEAKPEETKNVGADNIVDRDNVPDADSTPRNVVFLIVDESGQNDEVVWENFTASRPSLTQGFLENCRKSESDKKWLSLDRVLTAEKKHKNCNCKYSLRSNIDALLFWAQHVKEMATGIVSVTPTKQFEEFHSNAVKPDAHKSIQELHNALHLIDFNKQTSSSASPVVTPGKRHDGPEKIWDLFDVFSRTRVDLFGMMLKSFGGDNNGTEDEFPERRPFPLQPSLTELIRNTMRELKSDKNDKGYMVVTVVPGKELDAVVDVIENEISPRDTLLVLVGICSFDSEPMPYFARGPGTKAILEARTIWQLLVVVKISVDGGCHGAECGDRRRDAMLFPPSVSAKISPEDAAVLHKRIGRSDGSNSKPTDAADASTNRTSSENARGNNTSETQARSSAKSTSIVRDAVMIFGTAMLVIAEMLNAA